MGLTQTLGEVVQLVISGFPSHLIPFKSQDLEKIKWGKGEGDTEAKTKAPSKRLLRGLLTIEGC